jgi:hypothetical protein
MRLVGMALALALLPVPRACSAPVVPEAAGPVGPAPPRADGAHPAVARIIVALRDGVALGSGTLVGADDQHGLVVTNWHVVRDAAGPITVVFPDGFRSPARVLKTDRHWDLAALAIWRPGVQPVPISPYPPRLGEPLTIAGYGPGWYRAATGRCLEYLAPETNYPREMVELGTGARQGDSGGPIFNSRGEVAGVLFGTAEGRTLGAYGGRVRAFLETTLDDFRRLSPNPNLIAQATGGPSPSAAASRSAPAEPMYAAAPPPTATLQPEPPLAPQTRLAELARAPRAPPSTQPLPGIALIPVPKAQPGTPVVHAPAVPPPDPVPPTAGPSITWADLAGATRGEQAKTILAAVGLIALLVHGMHFFAGKPAPVRKKRA